MKRIDRDEILNRLRKKTDRDEKIVACTAASGVVGKAAEEAGADLIMCPYTAVYDADGIDGGVEALSYLNANAAAEEAAIKVMSAVKNTPVIAGVGMSDPYRNIKYHIKQLVGNKCSGVCNYPSAGMLSQDIRRSADRSGAGVERESEILSWCRENDIFTVAYIYNEEDVRFLSDADIIIADSGYREKDIAIKSIISLTMKIREKRPDAIVLFGGLAIDELDIVQQCIQIADVQGFVGGRLISLAPIEAAVKNRTCELRHLEIR